MPDETPTQSIATMLQSLSYSKQRVRDAVGTPYEVRRENLLRLDAAEAQLRLLRDTNVDDSTSSNPAI